MCVKKYVPILVDKKLSARAKVLYLCMVSIADTDKDREIAFRQVKMAEAQGVSIRTLQRLIKALREAKLIIQRPEKWEKKLPIYFIPDFVVSDLGPENDKSAKPDHAGYAPIDPPKQSVVKKPYTPPYISGEHLANSAYSKILPNLHQTQTPLSVEEREKLNGTEPIRVIGKEPPFGVGDIMERYGEALRRNYPYITGSSEYREPKIEGILYSEMSKTKWLLHEDPLLYLVTVLAVENTMFGQRRAQIAEMKKSREKYEREQAQRS